MIIGDDKPVVFCSLFMNNVLRYVGIIIKVGIIEGIIVKKGITIGIIIIVGIIIGIIIGIVTNIMIGFIIIIV